MATRVVNKSGVQRKRVNYPARMAARTVEVRPVGAWVQAEPIHDGNYYEAVISAQEEEERISREREEKEERLRRFQQDVKRRVQQIEQLKREQLLQKSYQAVEVERNVVRQTAFAAERLTPRKNHCALRDERNLAIKHSASVNTQGGIISDGSEFDEEETKAFQETSSKVKTFSKQARRNLSSRKVITEHYIHDDLPGGVWKTGYSRDNPVSRHTAEPTVIDLEDQENEGEDARIGSGDDAGKAPKVVHFDTAPSPEETRQDRIGRKSATSISGSRVLRVPGVPNIYPGVQSEENKQREISQRAMYRRLFMDIEREQVKENMRRKEHRKKICLIKKTKEEERLKVEEEALAQVLPRHPVTGETAEESVERERMVEEIERTLAEEEQKRKQKNRETGRYLDALKRNLQEKVEKQNVDLPPLCCCGPTVWDTNPDTCANNCVFYKNPKAYAKALQSLLVSCQVV